MVQLGMFMIAEKAEYLAAAGPELRQMRRL
jgi:hypothetical protein